MSASWAGGAPAAPEPRRVTPRAVATVFCATLCTAIYAFTWNSVAVALPYMQGSFSATTDQIAWVIIAYVIGASMVTGCVGWLSSVLGRRRLFLLAIAGFTATLVGCAMATSLWEEVFWRFAQGVAGAPLIPIGQSVAINAFPRDRHGQATSLWALGFVSANLVSPVLGGLLIQDHGWPWIFYAVIPVGLLALAGAWILVPRTPADARPLDWLGFGSLVIGVGALQLMLARGQRLDWFASAEIAIEATIAAVALYVFVIHTLTGRDSFIDTRLFLDRNFALGQGFIFVIGSVLFLPLILLPLLLQNIAGYPAQDIGNLMLPRGIGSIIGLTVMSQIRDRFDPRPMILAGLAATAFAALKMSQWTTEVQAWDVIWTTFIQGMAMSFIWAPLNTMALARLDKRIQDQGFAVFYLNFDIGSAIGTAAVVGLHARTAQVNHAGLSQAASPFNELFRLPEFAASWSPAERGAMAALEAEIERQATMVAYNVSFIAIAAVLLVLIPFIPLFRHPKSFDR